MERTAVVRQVIGPHTPASAPRPADDAASLERIPGVARQERALRKTAKEWRTRAYALGAMLKGQQSSFMTRLFHKKEIRETQSQLELAEMGNRQSKAQADNLSRWLADARQKRKARERELELGRDIKQMIKASEIGEHLRSCFFTELSKGRYAAGQAQLIKSLAELGAGKGVSTEMLKYNCSRNSPERALASSHFALVHLTAFIPQNGIVNPSSLYKDTLLRESIHFSLNSAVGSHMYGQWRGKEVAILMPLEGSMHWLSNFYTVDSYGYGKLKLPLGTLILLDRKRAAKEGIREGQMIGRAEAKLVNLSAIDRMLRRNGLITKQKQMALTDRVARMGKVDRDSDGGWERYNAVRERVSKRLVEKDVIESYAFESPMHFAVVRELLNQGKLPMIAGMWSWGGRREWWGNSGLSNFAKKHGFTEGPHQGQLGKRLEEISFNPDKLMTKGEVEAAAQRMMDEVQRYVSGNAVGGVKPGRAVHYLIRQIEAWERKLLLRVG